jgi:hypothetical protein
LAKPWSAAAVSIYYEKATLTGAKVNSLKGKPVKALDIIGNGQFVKTLVIN